MQILADLRMCALLYRRRWYAGIAHFYAATTTWRQISCTPWNGTRVKGSSTGSHCVMNHQSNNFRLMGCTSRWNFPTRHISPWIMFQWTTAACTTARFQRMLLRFLQASRMALYRYTGLVKLWSCKTLKHAANFDVGRGGANAWPQYHRAEASLQNWRDPEGAVHLAGFHARGQPHLDGEWWASASHAHPTQSYQAHWLQQFVHVSSLNNFSCLLLLRSKFSAAKSIRR